MANPYRDSLGRFSSGVGGGSRAKSATSPAKRMAGSGREVATIGRETMVMSKKDTPEQTASKVRASAARQRLRAASLNPSRGLSGAKSIADKMSGSGEMYPGPISDPRKRPAGAWNSRGVGGRKVQRIQQSAAWRLQRSN